MSITFLQTKSYTVNGAAVIASEVASSNNNDQSGTFTDGQQQQNQTATADGYHQFQQSSSSRHSYGTVDDYRNRIQNMFRLLENRPDQGYAKNLLDLLYDAECYMKEYWDSETQKFE